MLVGIPVFDGQVTIHVWYQCPQGTIEVHQPQAREGTLPRSLRQGFRCVVTQEVVLSPAVERMES